FKKHFLAINSQEPAAEIALAVDRLARSQPREAAGEALVILPFVKAPLQPRRRYFQRVGSMNKIFDVEHGAHVQADVSAILMRYAVWFVNKDPDDGLVIRPG